MVRYVSTIVLIVFTATTFAQQKKDAWVDSVYATLSTKEKIGQLFLVELSNHAASISNVRNKVDNLKVGGIILNAGNELEQTSITKALQKEAAVPLFIMQQMQATWAHPDSTTELPLPAILGAIKSDSLLIVYGKMISQRLRAKGVNIYWANSKKDDDQKLIDYNSLGENSTRVFNKVKAISEGLSANQILTCVDGGPIKNIKVNSVHKGWPAIDISLDSTSLLPYKQLLKSPIAGVVVSDNSIPLSYRDNNEARRNDYAGEYFSKLLVGPWLKENLSYEGLTFADVRNEANSKKNLLDDGTAAILAFRAGNDMLLHSSEIATAFRKIRRMVRKDDHYEAQLNNSVKKILAAKYTAGLYKLKLENVTPPYPSHEVKIINQIIHERALTILRNQEKALPITSLDDKRFAYIATDTSETDFYNYLTRYVHVDKFHLSVNTDIVETLTGVTHEVVIVSINATTPTRTIEKLIQLKTHLRASQKLILCDFGNTNFLKDAHLFPTVITGYTKTADVVRAMPQAIFGALLVDGVLPFSINKSLPAGVSSSTPKTGRLTYGYPETVGLDSRTLNKIDAIAEEAIRMMATPGCQVIVARKGKVVYDKTFGHLTYQKQEPVTNQTIYDLASLTKVSATLQAAMFMHERNLIDIYKKASVYLPSLRNTNKEDMTIIDMLTHQAGLVPFIPLWPQTMRDSTFLPQFYSRHKDLLHPFQVAPGLYGSQAMKDSVWSWIVQSKLIEKPPRTPYPYRYSDLGLMIMQQVAEKVLNQPMDEFLQQNFYEPLGAYTTGFIPLERLSSLNVAPTEFDKIFRRSMIRGTVHDERAAMMGGVSGHAGLFSTANDLAKLGQMLLQKGWYGGYRYFKPETIQFFSNSMFKGRRGIGWDKPIQNDWNSATSLKASPQTFGHTGFTGTAMWIDPTFDLLYIFLSNRVYPDRSARLNNANIRPRVQDIIYQAMFNYCSSNSTD